MKSNKDTIRVLIIGGGAAGSSAAYALARQNHIKNSKKKFDISLWEKSSILGGVATTEELSLPDGTTVHINDGVQGGSESYRNTLQLHKLLNFIPNEVPMKVSFGKDQYSWSNIGITSEMVNKLQPEIQRFGVLLKWIDYFQIIFIFISIQNVLWLFQFSNEFSNRMVYPLVALFFGTGNRTPYVSSVVISKVFFDSKLRLFNYCPDRLLSTSPNMFSFSLFKDIYKKLEDKLIELNANICLNRYVTSVNRITSKLTNDTIIEVSDQNGIIEIFDKIIYACDTETILKTLNKPSLFESIILGSVKYYNDVTITHCDEDYMKDHYQFTYNDESTRSDYFIYTNQ